MSERKYGQKGYMKEERSERRPPQPSGPREKPEGPRGRGLGAPTATVFRCAVCGAKQQPPAGPEALCFKCKAALRTCTHCIHLDSSAPKECRKPVETRVVRKAAANTCPLFEPKAAQEFAEEVSAPSEVRSAFDALFKL